MGVIALLGVVFALSGCAEKTIDAEKPASGKLDFYKNGCKAGKNQEDYYRRDKEILHNDCLRLAGTYRQQKDEMIGLGNKKADDGSVTYERILRINNSYGVNKVDKTMSEKYLQMGVQQIRERIAKPDQENPEKCYIFQDGAALNILRDDLHKLQLECVEIEIGKRYPSIYLGLFYDTLDVREKLYQYADFTPKQIEEALRKDYPLRAELISKVCKLYGDKYVASDFEGDLKGLGLSDIDDIKQFCIEAQELYTKGGSYNGVQVFAPNPNHQNVKIAQNTLAAIQKAYKQAEKVAMQTERAELEAEKAEERQRQAKEAKERKYRESIMAPIARDCQGKFNNKEICHIFKHKLLEFHFAREGSQYEADEIFRDLKDYVTKLSPKKLKAMEQELSSKKNLKYKGESYCRWSEPFVWWGLKYQNETDWSLKKSWARVCNFHQDVVLESPFYE